MVQGRSDRWVQHLIGCAEEWPGHLDLFNHLRNHHRAIGYNKQEKWNYKVEKIYVSYKEGHSESDRERK